MRNPFRSSIPPERGLAMLREVNAAGALPEGAQVGEWKDVVINGRAFLCNYGARARDGAKVYFAVVYGDRLGRAEDPDSVEAAIEQAKEASKAARAEATEADVLAMVLLEGLWAAVESDMLHGTGDPNQTLPAAALLIAEFVVGWLDRQEDDEPEATDSSVVRLVNDGD
jgi:hypothetical protein